jgi:S-DNA-T family DNA segregation ATPase FtsK/SpoIIIE
MGGCFTRPSATEDWTLHQISNFVALTRERIADESKPLLEALGWALPALQLPRDSAYFMTIRPKEQESAARWKKLFNKLISERKPLLVKQRPPRQIIENEELRTQFNAVRDDIPSAAHPVIETFINAPPNWRSEAEALSKLEWEADGVLQVFSGLRQKKTSLAEETIQFFEFEMPDRLSENDGEYLRQLKEAKSHKEPRDDDREFFESHREDLAQDKSLRGKWERFIFGRRIECVDFLEGLLRAFERLYGQAQPLGATRSLDIRTARRNKKQWLELNADVVTAFAVRYRGLPALMGHSVNWDTSHLFEYEALLESAAKSKKYRRNLSVSRTSLQIKFDITLKTGDSSLAERTTVQLIWAGRPDAIGLALPDDLERLAKRPLTTSSVPRQPVSRKGSLQSVSLNDVATLQPAFRQDSGSLVPRSEAGEDLAKTFARALKAATSAGRINAKGAEAIDAAWAQFADLYAKAINAWLSEGIADARLLDQANAYGSLLSALAQHTSGDINRLELWQPVLELGCVRITGGAPSAIIAPWHPLRIAASVVKARSVAGLAKQRTNRRSWSDRLPPVRPTRHLALLQPARLRHLQTRHSSETP